MTEPDDGYNWPAHFAEPFELIRREVVAFVPLLSRAIAERAVLALDAAGLLRADVDHSGVAGEPEATTKEASEIDSPAGPTQLPVPTPDSPVAVDVAGGVVVSAELLAAFKSAIPEERHGWLPYDNELRPALGAALEHYLRQRIEAVSVPDDDGVGPWVHDRAAAGIAAQALRSAAGPLHRGLAGLCHPTECPGCALVERADELERGGTNAADLSEPAAGAHDRTVAARALREAADAAGPAWSGAREWLVGRADEVERGGDR